ncbi:MAG: hypothetical protein H7144_15645 [Burkholderiales bacterium]|nr:hypothetical protein [Phycisphaerae bacterium]
MKASGEESSRLLRSLSSASDRITGLRLVASDRIAASNGFSISLNLAGATLPEDCAITASTTGQLS